MGEHRAARGGLGAAVALLVVVALLLGGAVTVEVMAEPTEPTELEPVAVDAPSRGTLHCPATAEEGESAVLAVAAAADEPTQVSVLRYEGGTPVPDDPVEVDPGGQHLVPLEGDAAQRPVGVNWEGGPAVATWRLEGRRAVAAPCASTAVPEWHVTGFDTTAQNTSTLHLFNPFAVDAVVRVTFGTPTGRVALVLTDNVLVPARSAIQLELNEFEPEQPDLAVTVEVLTGRVVPQGELRMAPTANQPGPSGRTLLPAAAEPSLEHAFAYARSADADSTWVSIFNPGDREAAVEVRVSDPLPDGLALLREISVPAGGVVRVELDETSATEEFGVALTSVNEIPVVATKTTHVDRGAAEDVAASVGQQAGEQWAIAGAGAQGLLASVSLYNPGSEPLQARVDAGPDTPGEWETVTLEANARVALGLDDAGAERTSMPLRVQADGEIVVDVRILRPGQQFGLWTSAGVPSSSWEGPGTRPPVRRDGTLSTTPAPAGAPDAAP